MSKVNVRHGQLLARIQKPYLSEAEIEIWLKHLQCTPNSSKLFKFSFVNGDQLRCMIHQSLKYLKISKWQTNYMFRKKFFMAIFSFLCTDIAYKTQWGIHRGEKRCGIHLERTLALWWHPLVTMPWMKVTSFHLAHSGWVIHWNLVSNSNLVNKVS